MHGCLDRLYDKEFRKLKKGDVLIVCGDFGYIYDKSPIEKKVINFFATRRFTTAFVEGTHDDMSRIMGCKETIWHGGKVHRIDGNLIHLMRGQVFKIEGNTYFTFGGGESIDKDMRVKNGTWWREEEPTPTEMADGARILDDVGCRVDYVITHEPPSRVKSAVLMRLGIPDRINKLNGYFEEIGNSCKFKHWYFGSLHEDRLITPFHTCVFEKLLPISPAEDYSAD